MDELVLGKQKLVEKILDYTVDPIVRQYSYISGFNRNIKQLETQLEELRRIRKGVQQAVDVDHLKLRVIAPDIVAWLRSVDNVESEVEEIIEEKPEVKKGWFPNPKLCYSLSRKAVKMSKVIVELQKDGGSYSKLSSSAPPACMTIPSKDILAFESRSLNMEEIIKALKDDEINLIGICGLPGVGKTNMAKVVVKQAKEDGLFVEVAWAVVSQPLDITRIQACIADMLGLKQLDSRLSPVERANHLREGLLQDNKKILVILDDVWAEFDLEDMGIPLGGANKNFKILYTSRFRGLWHDTKTKIEVPLQLLSEYEAWKLFREQVGDCADAPDLQPIAKEIVNACGCLPLALVIIGKALSNSRGGNCRKIIWEDVRNRLTCSSSIASVLDFSTPDKQDLSTPDPNSRGEKDSELLQLQMHQYSDAIVSMSDRGSTSGGTAPEEGVLKELNYYPMEDFPTPDKQDLSTLDPNSKGYSGHLQLQVHPYSDATVSMADRGSTSGGTAPEEGVLKELNDYLIEDCLSHFSEEEDLEEIPAQELLDLSYKEMKSLPQDIFGLVSLQKLFLRSCAILMMELPPEIGELTNLEVLDLEGTEILCLPKEISKLVKLTSLKVSFYGYANQTVIPKTVLSNLSRLKELIIDVTPYGEWWDVEVKSIIDDLRNLKELTTLKLHLPTPELLKYVTSIFPGLANFRFTVGCHEEHFISRLPRDVEEEFNNWEKLEKGLKFINGDCIPNEITKVLKHADAFFLQRQWTAESLSEFGHENLNEVKFFLVMECNEFQTIINSEKLYQRKDGSPESEDFQDFDEAMVLGSLERLIVRYMKNMESIWKGPVGKGSLSNLKSLALHTCPNLTTLFTIDMLSNLINLEELIVEDCPKINSLVSLKNSGSELVLYLPSLKKISLLWLPELVSISSGLQIALKLEKMVIYDCPKLEKLSTAEVSSTKLKVIKGEKEWWNALKWYDSDVSTELEDYLARHFIPLTRDGDLIAQLTKD